MYAVEFCGLRARDGFRHVDARPSLEIGPCQLRRLKFVVAGRGLDPT